MPIAPAIRRVIAEVSETPSCRWQRKKISLLGQHTHMGRLVQAPQRKCGKCRVCVGMSNADACFPANLAASSTRRVTSAQCPDVLEWRARWRIQGPCSHPLGVEVAPLALPLSVNGLFRAPTEA